ncbi:MAG: SEL1-like repeat protein [Oscillospiraceae bacterium]|nr:SEL1-like repeat protein [Oscillospiraceae bacterium]
MLVNEALNTHGNYAMIPNVLYSLGLKAGAIAAYGFLSSCECRRRGDRDRYTCHPSQATIALAIGCSRKTAGKYVRELDERDEHRTELRRRIEDVTLTLNERRDAAAELESLAEGGDAEAQMLLGRLYRDGGVLIPDAVNAAYWLNRAARQDVVPAQYALGKLLLAPDAETHDAAAGLQWLERAAQSGHSYAAYRLGKEYLTGTNTEKNITKAVSWFERSAAAGNQFAQYALGKLYLDGTLTPKDVPRGMAYMEQAARQGNAYAQFFVD